MRLWFPEYTGHSDFPVNSVTNLWNICSWPGDVFVTICNLTFMARLETGDYFMFEHEGTQRSSYQSMFWRTFLIKTKQANKNFEKSQNYPLFYILRTFKSIKNKELRNGICKKSFFFLILAWIIAFIWACIWLISTYMMKCKTQCG